MLTGICKTLQYIVRARLLKEVEPILCNLQFGYMLHNNCEQALLYLIESAKLHIHDGLSVFLLCVDFSA